MGDTPLPEVSRPLLSSDFIYFDILPVGVSTTILGTLVLAGAPNESLAADRFIDRVVQLSPALLILWLVGTVLLALVLRPISQLAFLLVCGDLGKVADVVNDKIPPFSRDDGPAFVIGPLGKALDAHNELWENEKRPSVGTIRDPYLRELRTKWESSARMAGALVVSSPIAWWLAHWHGDTWSRLWVLMVLIAALNYWSATRDAKTYFAELERLAPSGVI